MITLNWKKATNEDLQNRLNNARSDMYWTARKLVEGESNEYLKTVVAEKYKTVDCTAKALDAKGTPILDLNERPQYGRITWCDLNVRGKVLNELRQMLRTMPYLLPDNREDILAACDLYFLIDHLLANGYKRRVAIELLEAAKQQVLKANVPGFGNF